jgi:mannose-6-phosphate isomerase-like protein (cupin superfamily)
MRRINYKVENGLLANELFRKTLHTSKYLQVSVLSLKPDMEINLGTHASMDQYFGFKGGKGKCIIEGHEYSVETGDVIVIPAGSENGVTKFDCHKKD